MTTPAETPTSGVRAWAVILNPTKFDDPEPVKAQVELQCADHGWPKPSWYETTADDPGFGQAQQAIADGAELVCPLGGDGTVRAVASGALGSGVAVGLLPGGTGNLLARNLGLPVDDLAASVEVALTGRTELIDVGEVRWDGGEPDTFLVMAGMGLDAEIMAGVDEGLKKKVGWWAYVASGITAVFRLGFAVRVRAGESREFSQHARTVLVGNCGELTGGMQLIPQAEVDDGFLDVVIASPRSLASWVAIGINLITRQRRGHRLLVHRQAPQIVVRTREPVEAQLDGDAVGPKRALEARVLPKALPVRLSR
jgi:YegS/Rv2252/BmrU family lipid kinase